MTRVSRRQYTASVPSSNSTRSESKLFRTDQSIPLPIIDAISLGESTTESGPALCFSRSTLVCVEDRALGVGAPTDVSATGGSLVEWGPSQREAPRRSGSRNHQVTSATTSAAASRASRNSPLRQPFTVSDLVHRAGRLERALHQIDGRHQRGLGEIEPPERRLEPSEVARSGVARGAPQRHVRPKRSRFCGKPEWRDFLLHAMLQQLESGLGRDPGPHHAQPAEIGKHAQPADGQRQSARSLRRPAQRGHELRLPRVLDLSEKLEREMDAVPAHPLHWEAQIPQRRGRGPESLTYARRQVQGNECPHPCPSRSTSRPPRRYPRGSRSTAAKPSATSRRSMAGRRSASHGTQRGSTSMRAWSPWWRTRRSPVTPSSRRYASPLSTWSRRPGVMAMPYATRLDRHGAAGASHTGRPSSRASLRTSALRNPLSASGERTPAAAPAA